MLDTNTPVSGRLQVHAASTARSSGPRLTRTRKWTQPQERRKARTGGEEEASVALEEELKESRKKLPKRRASSLDLELLREVRSARADLLALSWDG